MIDLHTHTNKSDGTDSPRELVNKAIVQGLTVLGILITTQLLAGKRQLIACAVI